MIEKWNPVSVKDFILNCRADEGIPMFKTKFGGLRVWGKHGVLAVCWGGHGNAKDSVVFTDVPDEDIKLIEEGFNDWRRLLQKYGTPKDVETAESFGIYIKGSKIPRMRFK